MNGEQHLNFQAASLSVQYFTLYTTQILPVHINIRHPLHFSIDAVKLTLNGTRRRKKKTDSDAL